MARKHKQTPLQTCADCVHEYACCAWTLGGRLATQNAEKCPYFETVRSSAAYLIGKMEANEWISVKDRLPEDNRIVAFVPSSNQGRIYTGQFAFVGRDGGVMFAHREGRGRTNYYAKFWMPLPEPPKEE